jgi:hypothetical protein
MNDVLRCVCEHVWSDYTRRTQPQSLYALADLNWLYTHLCSVQCRLDTESVEGVKLARNLVDTCLVQVRTMFAPRIAYTSMDQVSCVYGSCADTHTLHAGIYTTHASITRNHCPHGKCAAATMPLYKYRTTLVDESFGILGKIIVGHSIRTFVNCLIDINTCRNKLFKVKQLMNAAYWIHYVDTIDRLLQALHIVLAVQQ